MRDSVCHQVFQLLGERGNGAVKAQRGPRVQLDLAQRGVFVEHVDRAELIEIEAHVRLRATPAEFRGADKYLQAG